MPRPATILRQPGDTYSDAPAERRPGEFQRHSKTGAPYVADPAKMSDAGLKKAELVELCAKHGIVFDPKATVPQLKALLGDLAKRGTKVLYGRPSNLGKYVELTTAIQKAAERRESLGAWLRGPDVFDELEALAKARFASSLDLLNHFDDPEVREVLDRIAAVCIREGGGDLGRDRGTHGHWLTERNDRGLDWSDLIADGEALGLSRNVQAALVECWRKMLFVHGIEILAIEATCVDDLWRMAGTLDRIVRLTRDLRFITSNGEYVTLPAGWVGILDLKTGRLYIDDDGFIDYWRGYSVQVASYGQSKPYDPDTDQRGEWPFEIDQRWAIIAHLDILAALDGEAKCRLVLVDLEAGRHAGALCVAAREWERRTDVFSIPTDDLCVSVPVSSADFGDREAPRGQSLHPSSSAEDSIAALATPPAGQHASEAAASEASLAAPAPAVEQPAGEARTAASPAPLVEQGSQPAAAARCAPGAAAPGAMSDDDIRSAYFALDVDERAEVARLAREHIATEARAGRHVTKRDATALALGWVAPFDIEVRYEPAAAPAPLPERAVRFTGDEGPDVTEAAALEARGWLQTLGDDYAAVHAVAKQAAELNLSFHIVAKPSRRRWEIYRGLACCARYGWADELVRDLLAAVTGDDACRQPAIALGQIVGLLDVAQATAFADLAARLLAGTVVPIVADEADGHFTFEPALAGV